MNTEPLTLTLLRPTGPEELALVEASSWRDWPPRLPEQLILYPVSGAAEFDVPIRPDLDRIVAVQIQVSAISASSPVTTARGGRS